jgi:hypothetical protein
MLAPRPFTGTGGLRPLTQASQMAIDGFSHQYFTSPWTANSEAAGSGIDFMYLTQMHDRHFVMSSEPRDLSGHLPGFEIGTAAHLPQFVRQPCPRHLSALACFPKPCDVGSAVHLDFDYTDTSDFPSRVTTEPDTVDTLGTGLDLTNVRIASKPKRLVCNIFAPMTD